MTHLWMLLSRSDLSDHELAVAASTLSDIYIYNGEPDTAIQLLIRAAIADIRSSTKETAAIFNLAQLLYKKGDVKNASSYIEAAIGDASYYGARQRKVQVSAILPLIEGEKISRVEAQKRTLITYSVITTLLLLIVIVLVGALPAAFAQSWPRFCAPKPDTLIAPQLGIPYDVRTAPGGKYCEGILSDLTSASPAEIVSVKQVQSPETPLSKAGRSVLTWCDDSSEKPLTTITLRSITVPRYGLDAQSYGRFEWNSQAMAGQHSMWSDFEALATQTGRADNADRDVVLPVRLGNGYSNSYSFLISSKTPLTKALVSSGTQQPEMVDIRPVLVRSGDDGPSIWSATLAFAKYAAGSYRVWFRDNNQSTKDIYVQHAGCRVSASTAPPRRKMPAAQP